MKIFRYVCIAMLFLMTTSCATVSKYNYKISEKEHSVGELHKEIDYVFTILKKKHPGIYWYITESKLNFKIDSLKKTILQPLKTKAFYIKLAPVIASINCGHTRLMMINKEVKKKEEKPTESILNQQSFFLNNNKLYVKGIKNKGNHLQSGDEIFSINGKLTTNILEELAQYIPSDGYNTTFKYALLNRNFSGWYNQIYGNQDSLELGIVRKDTLNKIWLKKVNPSAQNYVINKKNDSNSIRLKLERQQQKKLRYRGYDENKSAILSYKVLDTSIKAAYLKIGSFSFEHSDFDKFYRETFAQIRRDGIENLILDLRNNGGGSLAASRKLFAYLTNKEFIFLKPVEAKGRFLYHNNLVQKIVSPIGWVIDLFAIKKRGDKYLVNVKGTKQLKPEKEHYAGKLYVVTNGLSFSAATLLAANLKGIERATFVGTEAGGGFNQCVAGKLPLITLPTSGLKLRFGLYALSPNAQSEIKGRGIFPDISIYSTKEDVMLNKDLEIETIIKDIKN